MLNAYWENEKKDTLDLLLPFLKYSIAKTTDVGCNIDIEKLSHFLRTEFGYDSIPTKVITLLLNRLSPTMLVKQRDTYILKVPMDNEITSFEKGRTQYSKQCSAVAKALKDFLDNNLSSGKVCSEEHAMESLITFFATNGLCLIRDVALLEMLKKKDDALKYAIAQ